MRLQKALLGWSIVIRSVLGAFAGSAGNVKPDLSRGTPSLENQLRQDAEDFLAAHTRSQVHSVIAHAPTIRAARQVGDASRFDPIAWETATEQACQTALGALEGRASNPSGIAVCYNLPSLDNVTGIFQAEMRMYNITPPTGPWTGITSQDISLTLSYLDATVQATEGTLIKREDIPLLPINYKYKTQLVKRQDRGLSRIETMNYVGQINSTLMSSGMSETQLQSVLAPAIRLSAVSPGTGGEVTATLSSTEASFLSGALAQPAFTPTDAATAAASPFVLPGTSLGVFPVGLIVIMVWVAGFAGAVGYGTIGRIRFRDQYRRRKKRELAMGIRPM